MLQSGVGTTSYEQVYLERLLCPVNNDTSQFYLQQCNNETF